MSLMIRLGVRSVILSIMEVTMFCALSVAYFVFLPWAYGEAATLLKLSSAAMPGWVWIVMGLLYLLIVTVYWSPGEEAYNDRELLAFVIVVLAALIAFGYYVEHKYGILWQLANEFWRILMTQGGAK